MKKVSSLIFSFLLIVTCTFNVGGIDFAVDNDSNDLEVREGVELTQTYNAPSNFTEATILVRCLDEEFGDVLYETELKITPTQLRIDFPIPSIKSYESVFLSQQDFSADSFYTLPMSEPNTELWAENTVITFFYKYVPPTVDLGIFYVTETLPEATIKYLKVDSFNHKIREVPHL